MFGELLYHNATIPITQVPLLHQPMSSAALTMLLPRPVLPGVFADRLRVNLMDIACVAQILVEIHCCQGEGSRADQFETLFVGMW